MDGGWVLGLHAEADSASSLAEDAIGLARRALGPGPVAWAAEVAGEAESLVLDRMPELVATASAEAVRQPTEACTLILLRVLLEDTVALAAEVPTPVLSINRDSVRRNIALDRILHAMWIAQSHCLQRLLAFIASRLPPEQTADAMRRTTELALGVVEEFTARFTREYAAERDAWIGSLEAARRQIIDDLLASRTPVVRHPDRVLGLDLRHRHVGVVVQATTGEAETELHRVARGIVVAAAAPASVTVRPAQGTLWLWMTWPAAEPESLTERLRVEVSVPEGLRVGLGPPLAGPEGFRLTHLAAATADRVASAARMTAPPFAAYVELDVIALVTADRDQAVAFVRRELGPLLADDDRTAALRNTLRHYLAFERSRTAAAAVLHIAPNTVGYRIRQAEERLGAALPGDALRLRLALEIFDYADL